MTCSNPISPSLNSSSPNSSSSSPTLTQSSSSSNLHLNHHEKESNPSTFKTRTNLLRNNNSNRSLHHRSFSQGTVPLSPSNHSLTKSPTSSTSTTTTTTTTFNEPTSSYIYVQPASPLHEPNKSTSHHHHHHPNSNLENLSQNSNHPSLDPSIDHLTVRSRRARLPYFTPLIQPQPLSFPRRSPPKSLLPKPTPPVTHHLVRVHDYAHPPSNQPIHYISTTNPNTSPPTQDANQDPSSSPIKRPLHQKAKSETGSSSSNGMMRIEIGPHSNSSQNLLSIDESELELSTPMLRKKSGEVVRSSLKETRAKSAPATPTGPKYVHFDSHLEHVKHFLSQQRPAASRLVLEMKNFPLNPDLNAQLQGSEVWLRWIELFNEGKTLKGQVQVKNLSFQKLVAIRFTFDGWQTVSEVMAEHQESIKDGQFDRFSFSIRLVDQLARIEERKMFIAIRFTSDGREIWDNNSGLNYDLRFKKVRSTGGGVNTASAGINQYSFKPLSVVVPHHPSPDLSNLPTSSTTPPTTTISSKTSPITTEPNQSDPSPSTAPYQWSVTTEVQAQDRMAELRAELDRLVGDDLGLSMPSSLVFKSSSSSSPNLPSESPKLETHKKLDSISATNHLKLNSLTPFASRYDFTSSLKQAVISSPRFEERKWSFGNGSGVGIGSGSGVAGGFSQTSSPYFEDCMTSSSNSTLTDSVPRSELFSRTSPEVEIGLNGLSSSSSSSSGLIGSSTGNAGNAGNGNGQAVLESLRAFQEQKLKGGHNLEVSDYGDLVQNFCWGGGTENVEESNTTQLFYSPGIITGSRPSSSSTSGSHSGIGVEGQSREEIGSLLESVQVRFSSPSASATSHHQKAVGLGIVEGAGV
ncbi:carbohydrate-binding module family 21 [Melampsora larici-populina 98AG31]|uniref:Carbohydrate-binding module family 21 n=1 Tax=Melampsora larici-populina (strain 98AG31 / pathotype 3-4-7) TaxID=747676 RepID=F4R3X4_MELLP|nr:carbohydrate-binding module family 21 [Melampsora larici-populina 98AG31]EGG13086.1 carbohydrate-binding module family 21 [Melampsora larici-populina 98AG31]